MLSYQRYSLTCRLYILCIWSFKQVVIGCDIFTGDMKALFKKGSHFYALIYQCVSSDGIGVLRMVWGAIAILSDGNQKLLWPSDWVLCAVH